VSEPATGTTCEVSIAELRACGAHCFDPVRFHYIEALARRAAAHAGDLRLTLDRRVAEALEEYRARYEQARGESATLLAATAAAFPEAGTALDDLFAQGDFGGLRRHVAALRDPARHRPLAELVRHLDRASSAHGAGAASSATAPPVSPPVELKALRDARRTWTQLSIARQMSQSQAKAPENPGPINSHLLVLRSLKLMQDIAPEYLQRYVSYVDALLWLDGASGSGALPTLGPGRDGDRKRKPGRSKPA